MLACGRGDEDIVHSLLSAGAKDHLARDRFRVHPFTVIIHNLLWCCCVYKETLGSIEAGPETMQ